MALHFLRQKHKFNLDTSLICRTYSRGNDSGYVFDGRFFTPLTPRQAEEKESRVVTIEQPKEEKRRRVGRPKKQVLEEKPMKEIRSRAVSISRTRRGKVNAASLSSSRNELKMNHPDYTCSVTHAMEVLNGLPRVKKWTPLYRASMDHLMADVTHRQAFLSFSDPEDKIQYLRYKTKKT